MTETEDDELVDYDFKMPPPKHETVMRVDHDEHGSVGLDRSTHELRATCRCGESEVFAIGDDVSAREWWDKHHDEGTAPAATADTGPFRVVGHGGREYPGPKAPLDTDLDACPIWPCNDAKYDRPCDHDRRSLTGEIARLRALVGWMNVNDRVGTWLTAKKLGKDYGRASKTICELRRENFVLRSQRDDVQRAFRELERETKQLRAERAS